LGISDADPSKPLSAAKRAEALAVKVEQLLLIMNTNRLVTRSNTVGGSLPLSYFDRAEPMAISEATHADVMDDDIFRDAGPWDLPAKLDFTAASMISTGTNLFGEDVHVRRYRVVRRPVWPLHQLTRWIIESSYLGINTQNGTAHPITHYFGVNRPGEPWRELVPRNTQVVGERSESSRMERLLVGFACGFQLARDYAWRVHLKYVGADIGVMIPTTPTGIRALFRLRDYEAGESRRKALTHWVKGHTRRTKNDSDEADLAWVRDHLRGKNSFTWQDMRGAIYPSGYDQRRLRQMR
jgi:hypothetical protein